MWTTMASNRSRKFRSITGRISELDKQVGSIDRNMQTVVDGLGSDSVSADSILSKSVGADALQTQSITADKIAPSVFESASAGVQRVPAAMSSVEYWDLAISGNITAFSEAYFANKENKNVSVSTAGVTFSPESNAAVTVSSVEINENGLVVITTRTAHGWEVGDYINVMNLESPIDGEWVVTLVPSATTLCYSISQYEESNTNVQGNGYVSVGGDIDDPAYYHSVVRKSMVGGVVTLLLVDDTDPTTYDVHGYEVGSVVTVTGLGSPYDGTYRISAIPEGQTNSIQYQPGQIVKESFSPRITVNSARGDGENITYDSDTVHGISVGQYVEITGFTTNTAYNQFGRVSGVYGSGTTFTVASTYTPAIDEAESGGTYYCYNSVVHAEADAVLFLTGKNPVPTSRNIVVNWVSDKNIKFYFVYWESSNRDAPVFTEINGFTNENIYALSGPNKYIWEVPEGVEYYSVYAEVLAGGEEVLLKECYIFEAIGDVTKKVEKIPRAYVSAVANNENEITFYTASTHPYQNDDIVTLSDVGVISDRLNGEFAVSNVATDKTSFSVRLPVQRFSVSTVNGSNSIYTTLSSVETTDNIVTSTYNLDLAGLIFAGQPYTSANTSALANGYAVSLTQSSLTAPTKTGMVATLTANANTVTLTTGNTGADLYVGQLLTKTSGTGAFGNSGNVYVTAITNSTAFTVDAEHATSGSITFDASKTFIVYNSFVSNVNATANMSGVNAETSVDVSFYLSPTTANSYVALFGSAIGGYKKHQSTSVSPSGFKIDTLAGDGVNLTEDKTDNYLAIYNAESTSVASISNTGAGTFFSVDAETITGSNVGTTLDPVEKAVISNATIAYTSITNASIYNLSTYGVTANNITVSAGLTAPDVYSNTANTYIVGTFANATYNNGTAYTGSSYMDRLARGVIYQSYWDIPTVNVPSGATHFGLAYGTMNLEEGRAYQIHVGADGIKYSPNTNVNLDLLISDQPIQVGTTTSLVRMSQPLRANAAAYTVLNQNFRNMTGYFITNPATGSTFANSNTTNKTSGTISAWSKGTGLGPTTITLSNSDPLSYYLKTGDLVSISNIIPAVNSESIYYNGVFSITKVSNTTFTYAYGGANTTAASNNAGNFALVEPQMVNLAATFTRNTISTSTANTITYAVSNYFIPGQRVSVTGFTAPNNIWNVTDAFVTSANAVAFTVSSNAIGTTSSSPCVSTTVFWTANQVQANKTVLPSKTPLYWILRLRHDTATSASVGFTTVGNPQGSLVVTDIGQEKSLSYAAPNQASTTEWTTGFPPGLLAGSGTYTPPANTNAVTTVTTYTGTMTINAIASAYYDNYGKGDSGTSDPYANEQSLYQGNPGTASGTKKSIVVFSAISWTGIPTENRAVTKVEVYLRNRHSYNSGGLTTKIGVHGNTSSSYSNLPASIPTTNITSYAPTTTTFTKGQGKWVTLSSTVNSFALSSGLRGVVISLTDNSPITYDSTLANYGYFDGDLQSDPPRLRITYSYTVTTTT
jgi:hypothetical protein